MKCQSCGHEVDDGAKFCEECGNRIIKDKFCPECGLKVKNEAKFCSECGASLEVVEKPVAKKSADIGSDDEAVRLYEKGKEYAEICFRKAAEQRLAEAQSALGCCYINGNGVEQDCVKAAELGNADAQNKLADVLFNNGHRVDAYEWYKKSAKQGNVYSKVSLEQCYPNGLKNVAESLYNEACKFYEAKRYEEAFSSYKRAADQGFEPALDYIGECYLYGLGTERNEVKAFELFKKSAEDENSYAQDKVGECYQNGWGVKKDEVKAFEWFKKSAENGYSVAQNNLGGCYLFGWGVEEDNYAAFYFFEKAAMQGNTDSLVNLGICFYNGYGVEEDKARAVKCYKESAGNGNSDAQFKLGMCYLLGEGIGQNNAKAFNLMKQSAGQNNAWGKYGLGLCYAYGYGVTVDINKAIGYLEEASESGIEAADEVIAELKNGGSKKLGSGWGTALKVGGAIAGIAGAIGLSLLGGGSKRK